jgi:hypothetical protein
MEVSHNLGVTSTALVEYQGPPPIACGSPKPQGSFDMTSVSAEDVGQLIHHLQEEIKIIKVQLENLPGYASGNSERQHFNFVISI